MFALRESNDSITKPLIDAVKKSTNVSNIATGKDTNVAANVPKQAKNIKRKRIKRTALKKLPVNVSALYRISRPSGGKIMPVLLKETFMNVSFNRTGIIFPPDGLEILYKADTFTGNFLRAVLLILFRLIFLACLGTLAATFVSFPVAILLTLVLFFTASISGFVIESFDSLSANMSMIYSFSIK